MGNLSQTPRILKGAVVYFDLPDTTPRFIVFQYNPATLSRTLQAQTAGGEDGRADLVRFGGAPAESVSVEVEIDAADQPEAGERKAVDMGIYPQLSALEVLLYPKSRDVQSNIAQLALGMIEIVPVAAPFMLFVYGPRRVLPVSLTELSVTEEAHDATLNPVRAKVSLSMRVLSYSDLPVGHPGHALFMAYQKDKERMAEIGIMNSPEPLGTDISLKGI